MRFDVGAILSPVGRVEEGLNRSPLAKLHVSCGPAARMRCPLTPRNAEILISRATT